MEVTVQKSLTVTSATSSQATLNGSFPSSKISYFQNEAKCKTFLLKRSVICGEIIIKKSQFHINGFALSLALKPSGLGQLGNGLRMTRPSITLQQVFRDPGFAFLEGRTLLGSKVSTGCGMPKTTTGVMGLSEGLGRDDGIERTLGSGWRDWAKIRVGMTGLNEDQGRDDGIERRLGSRWRDWAKIWVGMTGLKNPIESPHCSVTPVLWGWEESFKTPLVCTSCVSRHLFRWEW